MPPIEPSATSIQTTMYYPMPPSVNHFASSVPPLHPSLYQVHELGLPLHNLYQISQAPPPAVVPQHHVHQSQVPPGYYMAIDSSSQGGGSLSPAGQAVGWSCTHQYISPSTVYVPISAASPNVAATTASLPSPPLGMIANTTEGKSVLCLPPVNPLMNSTNMEIVWHGKFDSLFSTFLQMNSDSWTLRPCECPDKQSTEGCAVFNDSAKVRFLCKHCGNAWTSMKGRVVFWIRLDTEKKIGTVEFKLFGQQCQKCMPGTFEHAMWYPEEVVKVVTNVYHHVGCLFYGFAQPVMSTARRIGKPRTQHNSKLCQACALHICRERFDVAKVQTAAA